jgi:hypothetical protein
MMLRSDNAPNFRSARLFSSVALLKNIEGYVAIQPASTHQKSIGGKVLNQGLLLIPTERTHNDSSQIPKSYCSVTGISGARKARGEARFESSLEHDLLSLLDFDPTVRSFEVQPVSITWSDGTIRRYLVCRIAQIPTGCLVRATLPTYSHVFFPSTICFALWTTLCCN